jgi:predicted component of type VI protein secretion system
MKQTESKFTIGRSEECDIVLSDKSVSRRHLELILMPDHRWFLIDCHSLNGTALIENGCLKSIHQAFVTPENTLKIGDVTMPVRKLLDSIPLSIKADNVRKKREPPPIKPWVQGDRLVRCSCGAIRKNSEPCPECGK